MCGFYYVLSGVAFCQLLLNEYCIVLYCTAVRETCIVMRASLGGRIKYVPVGLSEK